MGVKDVAKQIVYKNKFTRRLYTCYRLRKYLESSGWIRSTIEGMAIAESGDPIPWYTYPALSFLEPRIHASMRVFEYGSGNSTLWWSRHVAQVISCEHDHAWQKHVAGLAGSNVTCLHRNEDDGAYGREILNQQEQFDVIVIDGRDRITCAKNCLGALKEDGVVLWDNSDREEYRPGYDFLVDNGFRRVDFWGIGPINTYAWCTSLFYRTPNCLAL